MEHRRVAIVGGGISGLVAAERVTARGGHAVVFEASDRLGGQIEAAEVAGHLVDVGAESLHLGAPAVRELLRRLDLCDRLLTSAPSSAWIWSGGARHRIPDGVGPIGPTRIGPVLRSRVLSAAGMARAALEPLAPRRRPGREVSVGEFVSRRFGHQVTERFVDPLLGTLHSGDVDRLSLQAVAPQVASLAEHRRSILLAHRARRDAPPATFATFPEGLPELARRLALVSGAEIRLSTPVATIRRFDSIWELRAPSGELLAEVDAVILAVPGAVGASLLPAGLEGERETLRAVPAASVATVIAAYPAERVASLPAFDATGVLIPSRAGLTLKAATFLGRKWPHLADPDVFLVRLAVGRAGESTAELDDEELVARLHHDLAHITGLTTPPVEVHVRRWREALPQLEVGHLGRVAALRETVRATCPGIVLAGATLDGPGIASCVRSGEQAAAEVHEQLSTLVGTAS